MNLEKNHEFCDGTGRLKGRDGKRTVMCYGCHGAGIVPSDEGQSLLDFIKKYLEVDRNGTF